MRRTTLTPLVTSILIAGCAGTRVRVAAPATLPTPAPVVVMGALDGRPLLHEPSVRAIEAGAGPLSMVAVGEAAERERLGAFVEIPEGACLLGYARASPSVEDLDLAAFTDDGTPVAVDDAPDAHPTLLVCPPHPSRVYLAAVAASGEGLVAVGAQVVPAVRAAAVGRTMEAHGTRTPSSRAAEAWPGLDDHVRRHHDAVGGAWEVFRKVALAVDARVPAQVAFPLDADSCTDALVVPDEDVGGLDVEAKDDHGRLIARGVSGDCDRALTVCSPSGWNGSLSVRPHVGQGLVAVVLSRGKGDAAKALTVAPDLAWAAAVEPLDKARKERETVLVGAGYGPPQGSEAGALTVGALRSVSATLGKRGGGGCWRIDLVGGAPTALVSASVWDEHGALVASSEGPRAAALFACGGGVVRVDAEARARAGPFAMVWRPEPWTDASFATSPVAAARMLTRTVSGSVPLLLEGAAAGVRAFHALAGHEAAWTETVPAGACTRVDVGAEGEGAGLIGRVVDAASGDELDRGHGAASLELRACAPADAPKEVRVSLSVTAGTMNLVAGSRTVR